MRWILLKANTRMWGPGMGDRIFFILSEMRTSSGYSLYDIILIICTSTSHAFQSEIKIYTYLASLQCFGTLALSFHFLLHMPTMAQWLLNGPARVEWLRVNDSSPNEHKPDPAVIDIWGTGYWNILCQAIICTNVGLLSVGRWGTNFNEMPTKIQNFS